MKSYDSQLTPSHLNLTSHIHSADINTYTHIQKTLSRIHAYTVTQLRKFQAYRISKDISRSNFNFVGWQDPWVKSLKCFNSRQWVGAMGFPAGSVVKNPPANAGDAGHAGLIPGSGRSPGEGNGCPLQYSCLGKPMDRGTWRATFMGSQRAGHDLVTKRQQFSFSSNSNSGLVLQVLVRRSPHWHSPWGVRRGHQTLLQDSPGAPCTSLTQVHIGCFLKGGGT